MSQVYHLEPPTQGKVLLHTTLGDVDIELWPREAPLAVRNFTQHCLDGYYDGCEFVRVIKGFVAQTGDPTNTGNGGESAFDGGKPFKNEPHQRLRFNHRGQVALANEPGRPNSNLSQFFFTLGPCEHLNGTASIFGTVRGNTLFNVLKLDEVETDKSDRPVPPVPRILSAEVLALPFEDMAPREKKSEKDALAAGVSAKRAPVAVRNKSLLAFGDDEDGDDGEDVGALPPHSKLAADPGAAQILAQVATGRSENHVSAPASVLGIEHRRKQSDGAESGKKKKKEKKQKQKKEEKARKHVEEDIKKTKKQKKKKKKKKKERDASESASVSDSDSAHNGDDSDGATGRKRRRDNGVSAAAIPQVPMASDAAEEATAKKRAREQATLAKLAKFQAKVLGGGSGDSANAHAGEAEEEDGWMRSRLKFARHPDDELRKR